MNSPYYPFNSNLSNSSIDLLITATQIYPDSSMFLNFTEQATVTQFTGRFMFIAEALNVKMAYCYLYDTNNNTITNPLDGNTQFYFNTTYEIQQTVKKTTIYGIANTSASASIKVHLVKGLYIGIQENVNEIGTIKKSIERSNIISFTDGNRCANAFVKELYIDPIYWGLNEEMILVLARRQDYATGPLITIAELNSYDPNTNSYGTFFSSVDYGADVIHLTGSNRTFYMVVDWDNIWNIADEYVQTGELVFSAMINKYQATHLKFSPIISMYLRDHSQMPSLSPSLPTCTFQEETFE